MPDSLDRLRSTATAKALFIGFLVLVLLWPMSLVQGLIAERAARLESARADVAESWGRAQTIGGPMLVVPFSYSRIVDGEPVTFRDTVNVLPSSLSIGGTVETETLRRGIYDVPVYTARLTVDGVLPPPRFEAPYEDLDVSWDDAEVVLPLGDARPLAEPLRLRLADGEADFEAAAPLAICPSLEVAPGRPLPPAIPPAIAVQRACGPRPAQRLVVPFPALGIEPLTGMQSFSMALTIRGSGRLRFLPFGDTTDVSLVSAWPSPSFNGAFLPTRREVSERGFEASWRVLGLGRGYPSTWRRSEGVDALLDASAFGVDFVAPIGVHEAGMRAAKYGVLFFGLTFLAYFLFESLAPLRLHAIQYLAVGAANCMFFVLLLAVGEHAGFGWAYLISACASLALIGGYSAAVLGAGRRAATVVAMLAGVYGFLYVTLRAEDYALMFGAVGLFGALAAFMMLTRRLDWYAVSFASPGASERAPQ